MSENVNVGEISVDITAKNEKFNKALKESSQEAEKFDAHMLTSRHSVKAFSELADTPAAPVMSVMHAFEALPGPAGIALGALVAVKMAFDAHEEAAKKAAEAQEKFSETMHRLNKEDAGKFSSHLESQLDTAAKGIADAIKDNDQDARIALQRWQSEGQKTSFVMRQLDEEMEKLADQKFDLKMSDGEKSEEQMKLLNNELATFNVAMSKVQEGGHEWKAIKKAAQETELEIKKLNDTWLEMGRTEDREAARMADALDREAKHAQEVQDRATKMMLEQLAKRAKAEQELHDKITHMDESETDKMMDKLNEIAKAREKGVVTAEEAGAAIERIQDDIVKKMDRGSLGKQEQFRVIDTSLINTQALGSAKSNNKDKVAEEQLEVQRKMLEALNKKATAILGN